jgi:hypothetical protein
MAYGHSPHSETDRYVFRVFPVVDPMDQVTRTARRPGPGPARPPRWLFKVVDVVSGTALVEDANARATVHALSGVDSIFDVWIYVWIPELTSWRQLTPGEHRILWDFRGR